MNSPVRYCTICRSPVSLKRIMRASPYCSDECRLRAKKEMREVKAQRACRLCGRPPLIRKRKKPSVTSAQSAPSEQANPYERRQTLGEPCRELLKQRELSESSGRASRPDSMAQGHDERTALI